MALNARTPSYLQPTASTAQRAASSAPSKRSRPPISSTRHAPHQSRAPFLPPKDTQSTSDDDPSSKGEPKPPAPKSRVTGTSTAQPAHSLNAERHPVPPEPPHDALQVAAQVQSWLFMQSNLQDSLSVVQKGAQDTQNVLAEVVSDDTSSASRSNAEELITFLDDLLNAGPDTDTGFASFVDQFLEHEKSWLKLQSELTQFIARLSQTPTSSPLEEGQDIKARLSEEASRIESLLTNAEAWKNEPDRVRQTLAQLCTLLRARSENASIASDAMNCSLDNIRAMRRLRV